MCLFKINGATLIFNPVHYIKPKWRARPKQAQTLEHLHKHQDKMQDTQVPEQKPLWQSAHDGPIM